MKKILLVCGLFVFAIAAQAQRHQETIEIPSFSFGTSATGAHTVQVPGGKGAISFNKRGDKFVNVVYTDAAGKKFRLVPAKPGTGGAPQPSCKFPIPDACFGTADKNIGMCMCKPTDLTSNGGGEYTITLLLPAIQKVREAAAH
jgi:hypothetical protein